MKTVKQCIDIIFDEDSGLTDNTKKNYKKFINSLIIDFYKINNAELKYEEDFTLCFNNLDLIKKKLDFKFTKKTIRNNYSFYININRQITLLTQENINFIEDIRIKNNKRPDIKENKSIEKIVEILKEEKEEIIQEDNKNIDKDIQTNNQDNKFFEFFIKEKDTIKNKIEEYEKEIIILKQKLIFFDEYFNKFKDL